jgi:hypothetical protein
MSKEATEKKEELTHDRCGPVTSAG